MKRLLLAAVTGLSLSLATTSVSAQTTDSSEPSAEQLEAIGNLLGDMFGSAEPLSPDEEARLGAAMQVVTKLFPEGTYAKMMEETMAPMLDGMMGGLGGSPAIALSGLTGLDPFTLSEVGDDKLVAALALLDPAASERNAALGEAMFGLISEVVIEIEPSYRTGLARAYAVRFTEAELTDLAAYFSTPVGEKYAAESFLIFADPQVMASMNEMMPAMMQRMPAMMEMMTTAGAEFPEGRSFSQLDAGERTQLAQLLGVSEDELAASEPAPATAENLQLQ
jgi:hypothetical protein